jgi:hypothetical protein
MLALFLLYFGIRRVKYCGHFCFAKPGFGHFYFDQSSESTIKSGHFGQIFGHLVIFIFKSGHKKVLRCNGFSDFGQKPTFIFN